MIKEFFIMTVGALIIVSLPIVWLSAVDAINELRLRRKHSDDDEKAEKEYTVFESFENFVLRCEQETKIYVSPEIWIQCRKNDLIDFLPSFEGIGVVAYYLGRVIEEDKNEPFFRAEKE